ncbi:Germin-like protein 1 [Euphorbia peplus]|nr:Germin-like protein 1 [Euphorbia peplus]
MNIVLVIFLILYSSSSYTAVRDLCVADMRTERSKGFNCKKPEYVTIKDFVFSGTGTPTENSNVSKYSVTYVSVHQMAGLNGLGISLAIVNLEVGGFFPMHAHIDSSQLAFVASGTVNVGFITSTNTVYSANLKAGDAMVFPRGLLHYIINSGESPVVVYASFTSERIGPQSLDPSLFGNGLSSDILEKVTFLDVDQINKLKAMFGGTN